MREQIKYCPHCGGESTLCSNFSYKTRTYFVMCKCTLCGAQGKIYSSKEEPASVNWDNMACKDAIRAWNMRHNE